MTTQKTKSVICKAIALFLKALDKLFRISDDPCSWVGWTAWSGWHYEEDFSLTDLVRKDQMQKKEPNQKEQQETDMDI